MAARTPSSPRDHALIQAGMVLASELSLEVVLQRIVELAVEITGARYGALGVLTMPVEGRGFGPVLLRGRRG